MASSIDATKPTAGAALTADVRNNFSAAKTECTGYQNAETVIAGCRCISRGSSGHLRQTAKRRAFWRNRRSSVSGANVTLVNKAAVATQLDGIQRQPGYNWAAK